jgi:PKD repeat protein
VSADASGSTDPQGQTLSYAFDFGDGTTTGSQAAATAGHTYSTAGSYTVRVTVKDTSGLTDTTTSTVTVQPAPGYVAQVGASSSTASTKTASLTVAHAVKAGDMVVLTVQVSGGANKPVTATDDAGNTYALAESLSDSTGAKVSVLYGLATKPLAAGSKITASFANASGYRFVADELTGVTALDQSTSATGKTAAFSSGATGSTTAARELALGVVGLTTASGAPGWAAGWTPATGFSSGTSYTNRAYRVTSTTGPVTASGTATGVWTAAVLTFRP